MELMSIYRVFSLDFERLDDFPIFNVERGELGNDEKTRGFNALSVGLANN